MTTAHGSFGLLFVVAALIVIGMGIVVGVAAILACAVLIALGIISSSAAVGFMKRSPSAGLMSLLLQACGLIGAIGGIGVGLLIAALLEVDASRAVVALSGAMGGGLAGFAVGWLVHSAVSSTMHWLQTRVEIGTPK